MTFIDHVRVWSIRVRSCIGYDAISDSDLYSREITADCVFQLHRQTDRQTDRQRHKETHGETETHRQRGRQRWASDSNIRSEFPDQARVLKPSTIP